MKPDQTAATNDPGDETLKRYRFQATYSAIMSIGLLNDGKTKFQEIFCEHHEDILVKKINGKFIGIQVKTQDLSRGAFNSGDDAINKTLHRFVDLYQSFPDSFERFVIASNTGFSNKKEVSSLTYILEEAQKPQSLCDPKVIKWIQKKAKKYGCLDSDFLNVLKMIVLDPGLSGLDEINYKLIQLLSQEDIFKDKTLSELGKIADNLVMHHLNASSLKITNPLNSYFAYSDDPENEKTKEKIDGKRFTKEKISQFFLEHQSENIAIELKDKLPETDKISSSQKLEVKLDSGGISYENMLLLKDNKYSMEEKLVSWLHKWGEAKTTKKYNQVKSIVHGECQLAYDKCYKKGNLITGNPKFGTEMLVNLKENLKDRYSTDKELFFDCFPEHLYGMAGILTEECKVWWSKKFKI
ncbi:dsDNA nuclease domain-containing protein [Flavilitoribacter nigricans]|uniref:CD-NTase associated protein 4-like DNA endonuclease domain-containing protein n=1 Tax=Flavilitoribacter nigricans (strain ATCC 23147 / DSM 23189 / NBRC 102662 / NCIMB 1420 / SS-2) TaxID=1122177 RepID=A0A2D0N801_FLAN2|nr:dsDNA nuclease domain-containing protein [Flavilitoribacter nigricans]PHN03873.1 hypothetical protein CRP01_23650 [Flavilitoribacter nigricans DSM 23189 = NBRC 102662]